jgi:uncharacterized protein
VLPIDEYRQMRDRPVAPLVMHQRWRNLLFLHYSCPAEEVQRLLPEGLTVDTFDGRAWVGLVPFRMEGVRARFCPPVPFHGSFPETNVRTYVHREGREPGVWFFSLDASSALACSTARALWRLPYHWAEMHTQVEGPHRSYRCRRLAGDILSEAQATVGESLGHAAEGSLEFFLVERYLLYAHLNGRLLTGSVRHDPYPLYNARLDHLEDGLVAAAGLEPRAIEHALYSPGVSVRIYPLRGS